MRWPGPVVKARHRASRRRALVMLWIAALSGCAAGPVARRDTSTEAVADAAFEVAGRLSARQGKEAAAAHFRWTHRPDRDELVLSSPLGQTLATLEGNASEVRLALPNGRVAQAPDWEVLTSNVLGAPIPVRGLAWWVRGAPRPGSTHSVERDADARASVLNQDGWEVVYAYAGTGTLPSQLRLAYPGVDIRLVLDRWADAPSP